MVSKGSALIGIALLLGGAGSSYAIDGKHVNGISVFTQWFSPFDVDGRIGALTRHVPVKFFADSSVL
jgi:hypothetical protein